MPNADFDIVIVGGGLVGASLAAALAPRGFRLALVEAAPLAAASQPSFDDRTLALAWGSRRIFESLGLWEEIARETAVPIERIHITDRGRFGIARLAAPEVSLPALGYVVENRALGGVLWRALAGQDAVTWFCPARLEGLAFERDGAAATLRIGDDTRTIAARLVIGADGADSAVREAVGISYERVHYDQAAVVSNVATGRAHAGTAYERFTETGPLALLPMRDGRMAVVWSAHRDEVESILGWSDEEFRDRLQERFGHRLGRFARVGKRAAYPLMLTRVDEHVRERLALIGNAAHTVHPVAGQGFNLGLRDVAALAEVLSEARAAGRDIGELALLRRYADWRRRDNRITSAFTNSLVRIFSNDFPPLALARNLGLVAVDLLPPVKRLLMRMTSGRAGRLPRLARGLPLI